MRSQYKWQANHCMYYKIHFFTHCISMTYIFFFTLCCHSGNFSHGKFGSLSPKKASCNRLVLPNHNTYKVHAGSFRVSVIYGTLTWTAGALTCVRDHHYACIDSRGMDTPTMSQYNIFYLEKLSQIFLVLLRGFEPQVFGSRVQCYTSWAILSLIASHLHPVSD